MCLWYVNGGQMYARLNDKPLEAVDCFKCLELPVDGVCERCDAVNEWSVYIMGCSEKYAKQ